MKANEAHALLSAEGAPFEGESQEIFVQFAGRYAEMLGLTVDGPGRHRDYTGVDVMVIGNARRAVRDMEEAGPVCKVVSEALREPGVAAHGHWLLTSRLMSADPWVWVAAEGVPNLQRAVREAERQFGSHYSTLRIWRPKIEDAARLEQRLYGVDGDESLSLDECSAADRIAELDEPETYPHTCRLELAEFSVLPKGDYGDEAMMGGADIAELVAERAAEECWFEQIGDEVVAAAREPDVIAAFQAARDLLASKQRFLCADKIIDTGKVIIEFPGATPRVEWKGQPS